MKEINLIYNIISRLNRHNTIYNRVYTVLIPPVVIILIVM